MNNPHPLNYSTFDSPLGTLYVAYSEGKVRRTDVAESDQQFVRSCGERLGLLAQRVEKPPEYLRRAITRCLQVDGRFRGQVDLSDLAEFQQRALLKVMEIRKGEVRTYQWIAREIGAPKAMRAVGTAMARNPIPLLIPCHRVVRADYRIGEYGCGGPDKKRDLLEYEGVDVARLEWLARLGIRFQGSKNTHIFCLPGCYTGRRMKEESRVCFPSAEAARAARFRPCKVCKPA